MKIITAQELSELESKHVKVHKIETDQGDIVIRKPTKHEWKAAVAKGLIDPKMASNYDAADRLLRDTCVFPSLEELDQWVDMAPGIPLAALDGLLTLSGMVARERAGKSGAS